MLNLRGENVLVAETRQLRAVANPDVVVRYRAGDPAAGERDRHHPRSRHQPRTAGRRRFHRKDVVVLDPVDPKREAPNRLDLDLALAMGEDVNIKGFGLVGTLGGNLRVRAVPGARCAEPARSTWPGATPPTAEARHHPRAAAVVEHAGRRSDPRRARRTRGRRRHRRDQKVEGRASAPRATVYSDPARANPRRCVPPSLGRPLDSLSSNEARQLGAAKSALNAGTGLIASPAGFAPRTWTTPASPNRARSAATCSASAKYLSPKLYVGYGVSLLGTGR